jgi:hypothetical protein
MMIFKKNKRGNNIYNCDDSSENIILFPAARNYRGYGKKNDKYGAEKKTQRPSRPKPSPFAIYAKRHSHIDEFFRHLY